MSEGWSDESLTQVSGDEIVRVDFTHLRPVPVLFVRAVGPYKESSVAAWEAMIAWLEKNELKSSVKRAVGFGQDNPRSIEPDALRYDACVELSVPMREDPDNGIRMNPLPGGVYAVFRHQGAYSLIGKSFSRMCHEWAPTSGLEVDYRRPFLEMYLNDPAITPDDDRLCDLCVPVAPVANAPRQDPSLMRAPAVLR